LRRKETNKSKKNKSREKRSKSKSKSSSKYKYLGKSVPDVGMKGLDNPKEFRGILKQIKKNYEKGKIDKKTAHGELLLLYRLTYPSHNKKVKNIPSDVRRELRREIKEAMHEL